MPPKRAMEARNKLIIDKLSKNNQDYKNIIPI